MPTGTVPATHVAGWAEGLTVLPQSWPASDGALRRPPTWPARVGRGAWRPAALPHTKEHVQWSVGQVAALSCTLGLLALWVVRWLRTPKRPSLLVPIDFYSAIWLPMPFSLFHRTCIFLCSWPVVSKLVMEPSDNPSHLFAHFFFIFLVPFSLHLVIHSRCK